MNSSKNSISRLTGGGSLLTTSLVFGLIPVVVAIADGGDAPFVFMTAWGLGGAFSSLSYVGLFHRDLLGLGQIRKFLPRRETFFKGISSDGSDFPCWNWQVVSSLPRSLTIAFFAWSTAFIPEVVAAVLYESWPIFFVLLLQLLFPEEEGKYEINFRTIVLFGFIFLGVFLVVFSIQANDATELAVSGADVAVGLVLLFVAISFTVQEAVFVKWGDTAQEWNGKQGTVYQAKVSESNKVGYAIFVRGVSLTVGCLIGFAFSGFSLQSVSLWGFCGIAVFGAAVEGAGSVANMIGTIRSAENLRIQAIRYLTPVFGVIFLILASQSEGVRADLSTLGICAIVVGNVLVNFPSEERFGIASLVIALWGAGWTVLFRDNKLDDWFPNGDWFLEGESYFAVLALSATAFTLLLAFRINRITGRNSDEERLLYSLISRFENIKNFSEKSKSPREQNIDLMEQDIDPIKRLETIDNPKGHQELEKAYGEARDWLKEISENHIDNHIQEQEYKTFLSETKAELDTLAHSKQYGREYGEPTAVVFLGLLTITIALSTRPEGEGLTGVIFDIFGFIFAGTIAFLIFHIFDLHRERGTSIIEEKDKEYRVEFRKESYKLDWILSIVSALTVLIVISILIWQKWL